MVYLSKKNISKIKKEKSIISLTNEIFAAFVVNHYIETENIILDDRPDLHNLSKSAAYEIVQCDLEEDLNLKRILKMASEKIISIVPRKPYYYLSIFHKNIDKKMEKLNNGNYLPFSNVSLVILSTSRFKSKEDAEKIFDLFDKINKASAKKYSNMYLITTSGLYFLANKNLKFIEFSNVNYNELVSRTSNLIFSIKNKDSLYKTYPEIACEWHPTKNKKIFPYDIPADFDKKVWWKCPKGHSYQMKVKSRTLLKKKCPICSN